MKTKLIRYSVILIILLLSALVYCNFFRSKIMVLVFSSITPLCISALIFFLLRNYHKKQNRKMNYLLVIVCLLLFCFISFKGLSRSLLAIDISFIINTNYNSATIILDENLLLIRGEPNKSLSDDVFFISQEVVPNYRYVQNDFELESIKDGTIKMNIFGNKIWYDKFDDFIINGKKFKVSRAEFISNSQPFIEISKETMRVVPSKP